MGGLTLATMRCKSALRHASFGMRLETCVAHTSNGVPIGPSSKRARGDVPRVPRMSVQPPAQLGGLAWMLEPMPTNVWGAAGYDHVSHMRRALAYMRPRGADGRGRG